MRVKSTFILALVVFLIFNLRPGIVGQIAGEVVFLIIICCILVYLFYKNTIVLSDFKIKFLIYFLLFAGYLIIQSSLLTPGNLIDVIKLLLLISISVVTTLFIEKKTWRNLLLALIIPISILTLSYIISYLLIIANNFDNQFMMLIYNLQMTETYAYEQSITFPLSPMYAGISDFGTIRIGDIRLPRAIGFVREPGIYQVFVNTAYFAVDFTKIKRKYVVKILLFIGLVLTFSTAGIMIFILGNIYIFYSSKKINFKNLFLLLTILLGTYFFITADSNFGLASKLETRSGLERVQRIYEAWSLLSGNLLFGVGIRKEISVEDINFLTTVVEVGFAGLVLTLLPYVYLLIKLFKGKQLLLTLVLPIFLTMLLSQPLYDKAMSFMILGIVYVACDDILEKQTYMIKKFVSNNE